MPTITILDDRFRIGRFKRLDRISLCILIFTWLCGSRNCSGGTLRDLLLSYKIPHVSYTERQLSTSVQGTGQAAGGRAVVVYRELTGDLFVGPLEALEYDSAPEVTRTSSLLIDPNDVCLGSPKHVYFIDGYTLVSTDISPSAGCLLLLDEKLAVKSRFYGFLPVRIAPNRIAIIEDMVHFATTQPERMEVIDLKTSAMVEIYPAANDPLRERLALEHAKKMPSPEICRSLNDPCKPKLFNENFSEIASNGHGHLSFVVSQSASHALADNSEPQTVAEQWVFYSYAFAKGHWFYCEQPTQPVESGALQSALKAHFNVGMSRDCKRYRQVVPETENGFNPFRELSKQATAAQKSLGPPKR